MFLPCPWKVSSLTPPFQLDYIDKQKAKAHSEQKFEEVVTIDNY